MPANQPSGKSITPPLLTGHPSHQDAILIAGKTTLMAGITLQTEPVELVDLYRPDLNAERAEIAIRSVIGHSILHNIRDAISALSLYLTVLQCECEQFYNDNNLEDTNSTILSFMERAGNMHVSGYDFAEVRELFANLYSKLLEYNQLALPEIEDLKAVDGKEVLVIVDAQINFLSQFASVRPVSVEDFCKLAAETDGRGGEGIPLGFITVERIEADLPAIHIHSALLMRSVFEAAKNTFERGRYLSGISSKNRADLLDSDKGRFKLSARKEGENVILELTDFVGGFPWSNLKLDPASGRQRACDRDCSTKGGGIGLSELYHSVSLMGATVRIYNHRNGIEIPVPSEQHIEKDDVLADGAVITISFPISRAEQ